MRFKLRYTRITASQRTALEENKSKTKRWKAVRKALALMEVDLRRPDLQTHKFTSLQGLHGEEIFESYAENKTPAAYRIFWHYGPEKRDITVVAITPHP